VIFARLNRWTAQRLAANRAARRGSLEPEEAGIAWRHGGTTRLVPWAAVSRVSVRRRDAFIGDVISLIVQADGGLCLSAAEHDPEWPALTRALGDHLTGSIPYRHWALRVVAEALEELEIYRRG